MNADVEAYQFSVDDSDTTSQSYEMFEFSVADVNAEMAAQGGHEDINIQIPENSRISSMTKDKCIKGFNFRDDRLLNKNWIHKSNANDMTMFFRVMALCHTGIPVEDDHTDKLKYEAESPEEVAFLIASQEFGFQFCRRAQSTMVLMEVDPSSGKEIER